VCHTQQHPLLPPPAAAAAKAAKAGVVAVVTAVAPQQEEKLQCQVGAVKHLPYAGGSPCHQIGIFMIDHQIRH